MLRNFVTFGNDKKQIKTLNLTTMRKFFSIISATMFLFSVSAFTSAAQQTPELQKEVELLKKADKKMQSGLAKCAKDMKVMNQKTEENLCESVKSVDSSFPFSSLQSVASAVSISFSSVVSHS